jgi:hypothetical protein
MEINKEDIIERLKLFLKLSTYTYIQDIFDFNMNGFVKKINENSIIFKDDELGEIPIRILDIKKLSYSTKNKEEKK